MGWFLPRIGVVSAPYYTKRINYVLEVYHCDTLSNTQEAVAAEANRTPNWCIVVY